MVKHFFIFFSLLCPLASALPDLIIKEANSLVCTGTQKSATNAYYSNDLFKDFAFTNEPPEFATNSVLSSGDIYKLEIGQDNIYGLSMDFISDFHDVSNLDISQITVSYTHLTLPTICSV